MIRTNDKNLLDSFKTNLPDGFLRLPSFLSAARVADYLTPDAPTRQRFEPGVSGKWTTLKPLIISKLIFSCKDASFRIWLIY